MQKKEMVIGVCGSVGAATIINYIYLLSQYYNIDIIFTKNALNFVEPKGIKSFINNYYIDEFEDTRALHIELAAKADYFLILPASANVIAKMAHGIADDLLTSTLVAYEKNVYIAANMNPRMWNNSILQDNVQYLKKKGHIFVNEGGYAIEAATKERVYSGACLPDGEKLLEYFQSEKTI